ncbi:Ankyrin repeat-containing protein BDA1 [Camellia lanceoleosa]|nr:Ankyrin repeat-containing protein BDA1 [Camellia lanceoleosa]
MDPHLMEAARAGNINDLYARILLKPDILNGMNEELFVETPLHVAASTRQTDFALEILKLKPSFGKKLKLEGLSLLPLAFQNKHSETVRRLVKFVPIKKKSSTVNSSVSKEGRVSLLCTL